MSVLTFLWRYFRRYTGWIAVAAATTVVYATSTILVFSLLQPIFAEVIQADDDDIALVAGASTAGAGEETSSLPPWLSRLRDAVDPEKLRDGLLDWLRAVFDIDQQENLVFLPALFAVVIVLRAVAAFANGYIFQLIGLSGTTDLRNALYGRVLHQSSRFYAQYPSGELLSRVGNDITVLQTAISNRLLDLFQQGLTLIGLLYLLLQTQRKMAVMVLIVAPAIFYPIVRFGRGMRKTSHRSQERMADISNLVIEAVRGHRVVKAFGMERFELGRFARATRRHLAVRLRAQMLTYASGGMVETMAGIAGAFFLIYVGQQIAQGKLIPSAVVAFLIQLVALYEPVRKLNKVNLIFQEALAAGDRVQRVMGIENDIVDRPDARRAERVHEAIRFEGISFGYEDEVVLRDIDLRVQKGEVVALVGASGAGKSTLVNLLPRFFDPDQGRVTLDGVDLRDVTLASLRDQIGIVTQDTVLFNDSVRNNIAYGRADFTLEKVEAAARAAYADGFIGDMPAGYDTVIGEGGTKLSGGQRQRLAIARALVKDPPILILDEATSSLDSEAEALVQKALTRLMQGRTALVIAHRLSTVQRADRIVVMQEGRIVEEGTHESLLASGGAYRRYYDLQFRDADTPEEVADA